ncbi:hypothetical protein PSH84_20505 [Pseudomonas beijingensis]|jgi:hypothetical protein|uniref:Uncharacterized protein n=1 Tax=Pseudomonas beijingensis TaxID=2954101 RepID=A0ABY9F5U5_9PSED|nr:MULTISPECIES: hypothetical protein [unclassified Pseudomonas]WLG98805.1 hypothetical protein PSH92_15560 [Pseudomonas sp. FP2034]WLI43933.1 hypothetical protein PSH84_20505 [Pseudomonas sp. FP830]
MSHADKVDKPQRIRNLAFISQQLIFFVQTLSTHSLSPLNRTGRSGDFSVGGGGSDAIASKLAPTGDPG